MYPFKTCLTKLDTSDTQIHSAKQVRDVEL